MDSEHVVATYAAHILQFSTTYIHVSCGYRFTRGPKSLCSSAERFLHGETLRFGESASTAGLYRPEPASDDRTSNVPSPPLQKSAPFRDPYLRFGQARFQRLPVKGDALSRTRTPPPNRTSEEMLSKPTPLDAAR